MAIPRPIGPPARMGDGGMMPPDVRHMMPMGGVKTGISSLRRLGGWGTASPSGLQTSMPKRMPVVGPRPFYGVWMSSLHPRGMGGRFMGRRRRVR
jgi:hypothetical protein